NVDDPGAGNGGRIIDAGIREIRMVAELLRALFREIKHVVLGTEMQATRGARLDARRLESLAHAVGAERAFEHAMGCGIHLRNVERAAGDAVAAADAVRLLEIYDTVGVLDDGAVGGAPSPTPRLPPMHPF